MGIIVKGPTATITDETMQGADGRGYLFGLPLLWEQLVLMVETFNRRTSSSFHNNTTETKVFDVPLNGIEWPQNLRLQIIDQVGDDQSLFGRVVSHDSDAGTLVVEVSASTGAGAWSSSDWVLFALGYVEPSPTPPPGTVAAGMTGATTPAGARFNLGCMRHVHVESVQIDPPSSPTSGASYLLLKPDLSVAACSGAWNGHEGELATEDGAGGWTYETLPLDEGISVFINATKRTAMRSGGWVEIARQTPHFEWLTGINPEEAYLIEKSWFSSGVCTVLVSLGAGQAPRIDLESGVEVGAMVFLKHQSGPDAGIYDPGGSYLGHLRANGEATLVHAEQDDWYVVQGALG